MSGQGGQPPGGGNPQGAPSDQSMEDILASIRRILNEDEPVPTAAPEADAEAPEPLLLTEDMMVPAAAEEPAPEPVMAPEPEPAAAFAMEAEPEPEPEPEPEAAMQAAADPTPEPEPVTMPEPVMTEPTPAPLSAEALLAPTAAAAAAASVGQLLRAVSTERSSAIHRGGPTIEDVVREELRPLLKDWLDQHLPPLVERLVRAEIERVVGRALG